MKALMLIADGFEDLEFFYPYYRLLENKIAVDVAGPEPGEIKGKHGYSFKSHKSFSQLNADDYDFLVLPGGMGPEKVRLSSDAVRVVREMWEANKVIASICHGIQVLISADVLRGVTGTCWPALQDDFRAAGGIFEDKEVVIDGKFIFSRSPLDLPAFCRELFHALEGQKAYSGYGHASV